MKVMRRLSRRSATALSEWPITRGTWTIAAVKDPNAGGTDRAIKRPSNLGRGAPLTPL